MDKKLSAQGVHGDEPLLGVFTAPPGSIVYGVEWDWWTMKHVVLWRDPDGEMHSTTIKRGVA